MTTPPIVAVRWIDAAGADIAWYRDEIAPADILTVGFLSHKTKHAVTVAHSLAYDGQFGGGIVIPLGCVKKLDYIIGGK
jgi:hypothetical protein